MGSWNHRLLAHIHDEEVYLQVHEVYYNDDGIPNGYSENPVTIGSEEIKGIKWVLTNVRKCLDKPILYAGSNFPAEYN